jgi:hypothetical protein
MEEQPVHSCSHPSQLIVFPARHTTVGVDLSQISLLEISPPPGPFQPVGSLMLVYPFGENLLYLFLLLLLVCLLFLNILNQMAVRLARSGYPFLCCTSFLSLGIWNCHTEIVDSISRNYKERL